ncbi:tyrosine-type recombinase/integrase [Desulfosporosinus sp. FKB]|uniref:tyrosine-type recombinase/integrase n=1 Tax=Desulfosporosinus sp. FKB TaxID=1969835 RepID=UPI000B49E7AF|nr:tyrosine-type recombinase/integrase [Desulfosporosinus sp. FKB]
MRKRELKSVFSIEMNQYLDYMVASGHKEISYLNYLRQFDRFCVKHKLLQPVFTRQHAVEWIERKQNEASTTHYARINRVKHFLLYLSLRGYSVFVTRDVNFRQTDFQPHIYSEDEIAQYFHAVDTYESSRNRKDAIQFPILFRLLYCCGTRINETLGIRKQDVDLEDGIIRLFETKNDCERYIVLSDELAAMMRQYAEKCFYLLDDKEYIFTTSNGGRLSGDVIYDYHRLFLQKAGIPYLGGGKGPRLHDWRHTFSVHSFKQMIDAGLDMYVALPILSTYLGHKTIYATERYVRLTMSLYPYIEERFKDKMDKVFGEAGKP